MARKTATRTKRATANKREAPKKMDFLTINGMTLSLGDLRKADFSGVEIPKSTVSSIVKWATQITAILQGITKEG
jgi:hypothetical protein